MGRGVFLAAARFLLTRAFTLWWYVYCDDYAAEADRHHQPLESAPDRDHRTFLSFRIRPTLTSRAFLRYAELSTLIDSLLESSLAL